MRQAALIFNSCAGGGRAVDLEELRRLLDPHLELTVFHLGPDADPAWSDALTGAGRLPDLAIAAGGDGTVSTVAARLVGTRVPLGIIPCGTANSIATALGVPADLAAACANLHQGLIRRIDTARVDGRPMVLHTSVGLQAEAVCDTPRERKQRWGVLAYLGTGLDKLRELAPFHVEMEADAAIIRCRASTITIANLAPITTVLAQGPSAVVGDDALLDVTVVTASSLTEVVATGLHLLRSARQGEPATRDNVGYFSTRRLVLRAEPPQRVLIDGEAAGETPITVELVPRSLSVLVPAVEVIARPPEEKLAGLPELEVEEKPTAVGSPPQSVGAGPQ